MSDELLALAVRCEAATAADPEIDARIWCALNGKKYAGWFDAFNDPARVGVEYTEPPKRTRLVARPPCLRFTASLDAAMTLIPEGWQGDGLKWWEGEGASCDLTGSRLVGDQWTHHFDDGRVSGCAATPALALCAAALRAKATTVIAIKEGGES